MRVVRRNEFSSIREPHVVRALPVISTSLCAIGTPASGPAAAGYGGVGSLRRGERAFLIDLRNALSVGPIFAMRSGASRATSTADTSLRVARRARDVSSPVFIRRRAARVEPSATAGDLPVVLVAIALGDLVVAQRRHDVLRVRHRLDAGHCRSPAAGRSSRRSTRASRAPAPPARRSRCGRGAQCAGRRRA